MRTYCLAIALPLLMAAFAHAAEPKELPGDRMLAAYFKAETAKLRDACLADVKTLDDWNAKRGEYRRQLAEMLGLDSLPPRTDLKATVTGRIERDDFSVEKLHFQSKPGLYVTANLYLPKNTDKPSPAILYLCGHGQVKKDGVSYGNKVHYQHHGIWLARHGYVCLTIDTLQLGEIEGIHHGTNRFDSWWWNSRGYTPAGVEAWNAIRAIDYLQTRKEVDRERIGATGRSGGGAYTWFVAALDDRVKVAVPVAGITDLQNHVVDGVVEGHCDCMYFVNTYRWDYPQLAALVAPRPLLISNTDKDRIFPLDGVQRTHAIVRRIYKLHGAEDKLGLHITDGPHADTQELYIHSFVWFDRFLGGGRRPIEGPATPQFEPQELKVFDKLPADEINTKIDETFVPAAPPIAAPKTQEEWAKLRDGWMKDLREKAFRSWPENPPVAIERTASQQRDSLELAAYQVKSQEGVDLPLYILRHTTPEPVSRVTFRIADQEAWQAFLRIAGPRWATALAGETLPQSDGPSTLGAKDYDLGAGAVVYFAPRGVGRSAWNDEAKEGVHNRRRFMLLGQTVAAMRVWDARRAIQAVRSLPEYRDAKIVVSASRAMAPIALYAALFEPDIAMLRLHDMPGSHRGGPDFLNVWRSHDLSQAIAMAVERSAVEVTGRRNDWSFVEQTARRLEWDQKAGLSGERPRFRVTAGE